MQKRANTFKKTRDLGDFVEKCDNEVVWTVFSRRRRRGGYLKFPTLVISPVSLEGLRSSTW